mgnify:CR=1 FL=1
MNILFKKLLLLFCLCCSFHYTLKAQIDIEKISGIETEKFEGIIDSLHHTYEYFNYPSLVINMKAIIVKVDFCKVRSIGLNVIYEIF